MSREKKRTEAKRSPVLLLVLLGGAAFVLLLLACGGGVGLYFAFFRGATPADARGSAEVDGKKPLPPVNVSKESLDKLQAGMSIEEAQQILGTGSSATEAEVRRAFPRSDDADGHIRTAMQGRTEKWHLWQSANKSIAVGLAKGRKTGKDRVVFSVFVENIGGGFVAKLGISGGETAFGADPDKLAEDRDERTKILSDPKWKTGNARQLLVGKWRAPGGFDGYDFGADGSANYLGLNVKGTYQFIDNDRKISFTFNNTFGQTQTNVYWVLVSDEDLILRIAASPDFFQKYNRTK